MAVFPHIPHLLEKGSQSGLLHWASKAKSNCGREVGSVIICQGGSALLPLPPACSIPANPDLGNRVPCLELPPLGLEAVKTLQICRRSKCGARLGAELWGWWVGLENCGAGWTKGGAGRAGTGSPNFPFLSLISQCASKPQVCHPYSQPPQSLPSPMPCEVPASQTELT